MSDRAKFKFERLHIWQDAMELGEKLDSIADGFPQKEIYNLSSQMRRAVDSVALNISVGSILQSVPENKKFLGYSVRSLAEVVTCLHKAKRRNYVSQEDFEKYYQASFKLMNMIIAFRKKL